jgi:excisionase family DNA binding protein
MSVLSAKWADRETFTVDEVAEIMRVARWTAYSAVADGTIPAIRIGRRLIVPRHALERLLSGTAVGA